MLPSIEAVDYIFALIIIIGLCSALCLRGFHQSVNDLSHASILMFLPHRPTCHFTYETLFRTVNQVTPLLEPCKCAVRRQVNYTYFVMYSVHGARATGRAGQDHPFRTSSQIYSDPFTSFSPLVCLLSSMESTSADIETVIMPSFTHYPSTSIPKDRKEGRHLHEGR